MKITPALIAVFALACSCNNTDKQTLRETEQVNYSDEFQPEQFNDPFRMMKIAKALPLVEEVYLEYPVENDFPGFAYGVVIDDSLVLSGGTGMINKESREPVTPESLFRIASMTKSFTAMAVLKLRDAGLLDIDDHAFEYIPELRHVEYLTADAPPLTIRNFLMMTSGFPEDNPWGDRQLDMPEEELIQLISGGVSFSRTPGIRFEYSNLGYALLGQIIKEVSGKTYQEYITMEILHPLGMRDTYWEYEGLPGDRLALGYRKTGGDWVREPYLHDGVFGAMGGLITSIEDFSRYVSFLLSAWPPRSDEETGPVKRSSVREMMQMGMPQLISEAVSDEGNPCPLIWGYGYGLGIIKNCEGERQVSHSGGLPGFGSNFVIFPDHGAGFISFCNRTYGYTGAANDEAKKVLFDLAGLERRHLPVPDILARRKDQVVNLITSWDEQLCEELLAENFFLDQSREEHMKHSEETFEAAGEIIAVHEMNPYNELRGSFLIEGEEGVIQVFFSMTPQAEPRVQRITLNLLD